MVYAPWPTALAVAATAAGAAVVSGFAMLLRQAADQVELMTGKAAPLEAMRAAGEAELARRTAAHRWSPRPVDRAIDTDRAGRLRNRQVRRTGGP